MDLVLYREDFEHHPKPQSRRAIRF